MANIKSQKKRNLQNERDRQRNVAIRSKVRTLIKQADEALHKSEDEKVKIEKVKTALSAIDRACTKGVLHRNSAARKKSELQRHVPNL